MQQDYPALARTLTDLLSLQSPPLAITFSAEAPAGVARFEGGMPPPTPDGRTGRVPASCVFWIRGEAGTFTTVPEDHGNCSVGSLTHGLKSLDEAATGADVAALVESGWVSPEMFPQIPVVKGAPRHVTYGPLAETPVDPDVVYMRVNAKQAMMLSDAVPGIQFEGKPQCHILAIAREQDKTAISVGCMLSRVRTGMPNTEMSCAVPGARLTEVVGQLSTGCAVDGTVAAYASEDTARFR